MASTRINRRRLLQLSAPAALAIGLAGVPTLSTAADLPLPYKLLNRINQERAARGLGALAWNARLNDDAQNYARALRANGDLNHYLNGTNLGSRANAAGYTPWRNLGETLAAGQWSPDEVVNAWINSPAHNAVMFSGNYREAGIGLDYGGKFGIYWCVDYGAR